MTIRPTPASRLITRRSFTAAAAAVAVPGLKPTPFPILDIDTVPHLNAAGRQAYRRFLMMNLPRAFAISPSGHTGAAGSALTSHLAQLQALAECQRAGGQNGQLYALDLSVVLNGASATLPPEQRPLIETWNYSFSPDARYFWRGPRTARGVYIWAHGTSTDPTGLQPPPHVRLFNNAGFDIVRFDRVPNADDVERAATWLRAGIKTLRQQGWTYVVAGGHSRGAWNCLQMCKTAGLADLAIAESPAAHGVASGFFMSSQTDDLRQIVNDVPTTRTRLAFVQFKDDPYIGDPDERIRLIERLRPRLAGLLTIDRPNGYSGHFAARDIAFAEQFGSALLAFAQ